MIPITKSDGQTFQPLLEAAKQRGKEGDANAYRTSPIFDRIKQDFFGKCYLCEDDEPTAVEIDHFQPHRGDLNKKFDWNNLFYACHHCNGVKGVSWPLLNCTNPDHQIWESLEIRFKPFPKATVEVRLSPNSTKPVEGENTRGLLEKIFEGKDATPIQRVNAESLRKKINRVYGAFQKALLQNDVGTVQEFIADQAPFAGIMRWVLKNDYPNFSNNQP